MTESEVSTGDGKAEGLGIVVCERERTLTEEHRGFTGVAGRE